MNVIIAVNERSIEKYVTTMKECNVIKVVKNNKTLIQDILELNPHILLISNSLPGKASIEDIILEIRSKHPSTRIAFLYGADDPLRKRFTNILIENQIFDFHVGVIDEDTINALILQPKTIDDVSMEDLSIDEQKKAQKQLEARHEYLKQLMEHLEKEVYEKKAKEMSPGDTSIERVFNEDTNIKDVVNKVISVEEKIKIEEEIEEKLIKQVPVKELEVQIIERVEEIETVKEVIKVKVEKETIIKTKVIKKQIYSVISLYNSTIKDLFVANFSHQLAGTINQDILLIDFETPFPSLDHHFNIDKSIYINDLHSSKQLTGISGCLSALKKNILNAQTFNEFTKKIKGYDNLHILTGLYDIDEFDRTESEDIDKIIEFACEKYDTVIISLNSFFANVFTYSGLTNSDKVILITEPTYVNARADISLINELTTFHNQDINKFNIVMWGNLMDNDKINKLFENYTVLGKIKDNSHYLNSLLNKEILTKKITFKKETDGYLDIINKLGYVPNKSLFKNLPFFKRK
ncbi:MinD/ParA family protein [Clostridium akagii]|uniref:MinD/ParA family protein n=1 Tax=Clostridium akagii TaxID=91623 RepID=UPI00047B7C93|nr:MinD/ParA family protein [Clostridium akagii]